MKKKLVLLLAALCVTTALAGCGDKDNNVSGQESVTGQESSQQTETGNYSMELSKIDVDKVLTLGDYKSISVEVTPVEVNEEDVVSLMTQVYMENLGDEEGITDRAVANGDTVVIDYEGKKDGVAFSGGTAAGQHLTIGSKSFIDGFEDGLIGVMPGETVDLNLTFPKEYSNAPDLAGQPVVFTVTVHSILPDTIAEENMKDETVKAIGLDSVNTVKELRDFVYQYLFDLQSQNSQYEAQTKVLDALLAASTFGELPTDLLDKTRTKLSASIQNAAASNGVNADTYTNYYYGVDFDTFLAQQPEQTLKENLLLQAVANAENLNVSDEELDKELSKYATQAGYDSVDAYVGNTNKEDYRDYFMSQKVLEYLVNQSKSTEE